MKSFRLILSLALTLNMAGVGQLALAQEAQNSPFSLTLSPVVYADVKGNVAKFRQVNWMKDGADEGVSDLTFVKEINKNVSVDFKGSAFPTTENFNDELTLRDGDLAFMKIKYKAFRKYYDNKGGTDADNVNGSAARLNGIVANSPNLQVDVGFFRLEAGLGEITDPFIDLVYEHNSKSGDKSLLSWGAVYYTSSRYNYLAPSWESVDNTSDIITLKENKEIAGIRIRGEQKAEFDYNHTKSYIPYSYNTAPSPVTSKIGERTQEDYLDAKLFGSGLRFEKWMLNDKTFAALGYHYNHLRSTDLMQNVEYDYAGVVYNTSGYAHQSLWSPSHASEDEHVFVGNFNSNLTPNLSFVADGKYEHTGSKGASDYLNDAAVLGTAVPSIQQMENIKNNEGEHMALRYSGISHTTLYLEGNAEQNRDWYDESMSGSFVLDRIAQTEKASWALGGRVVPNKYFVFTSQYKQGWDATKYHTLVDTNPGQQTFLDQLNIQNKEISSTLTWKPYRFLQNSFRYQFLDTIYDPRASAEGTGVGSYPISRNRALSSVFTYDITLEPIDPLMFTLSYSHVESYIRTLAASQAGIAAGGNNYIPPFNSGDNSWLFSTSYTPRENVVLTNSVTYTRSNNYVNFSDGIPYGSSFQELDITTSLEWDYHKWLKFKPTYKYASYRGNPLVDGGSYSAHIYMMLVSFDW